MFNPQTGTQQAMLMAQLQQLLGGGGQQGAPQQGQQMMAPPQMDVPQTASPFQRLMAAMGAGAGVAGTPMQQQTSQQLLGMVRGQDQRATDIKNQNAMMQYQSQLKQQEYMRGRADKQADYYRGLGDKKSAFDKAEDGRMKRAEMTDARAEAIGERQELSDMRNLQMMWGAEGNTYEEVLANSQDAIKAKRALDRARKEMMNLQADAMLADRDAQMAIAGRSAQRIGNMQDNVNLGIDSLMEYGFSGQARDLQQRYDSLMDLAEDVTTTKSIKDLGKLNAMQTSFEDTFTKVVAKAENARSLLSETAQGAMKKVYQLNDWATEAKRILKANPEITSRFKTLSAMEKWVEERKDMNNPKAQQYVEFGRILTAISSTEAFGDAGKALTGPELKIVIDKILSLSNSPLKLAGQLDFLISRTNASKLGALRRTGMSEAMLMKKSGFAPMYETDISKVKF